MRVWRGLRRARLAVGELLRHGRAHAEVDHVRVDGDAVEGHGAHGALVGVDEAVVVVRAEQHACGR